MNSSDLHESQEWSRKGLKGRALPRVPCTTVRGYATDKTMPFPTLLQYKAHYTLDFQTVKNY